VGSACDVKTLKRHFPSVVFAVVYIAEAHAADEWPAGDSVSFTKAPTSVEERLGLARNLANEQFEGVDVLVDALDNTFLQTFSAWPFRYFVVEGGRLVLKAQPDSREFSYNVMDIEDWLTNKAS